MKYWETREAQDKIDPLMKACVAEWNKIPGLTTVMSCQSHFYDDEDFDQCEQVDEFVEEGASPYVAFQITDSSFNLAFARIMLALPDHEEFTIERRDQVGTEMFNVWYIGYPYGHGGGITRVERIAAINQLIAIAERAQ